MIHLDIDITQKIIPQFKPLFEVVQLSPGIAKPGYELLELPGRLELYHFKRSHLTAPIQLKSTNPPNSKWLLIHINLGKVVQQKTTDQEVIEFHKLLPIGILLYCPGLVIETPLPPNQESELASIRMPITFVSDYLNDQFLDNNKTIIYEDLDFYSEKELRAALGAMDNKMKCHAHLLQFINLFFRKIENHEKGLFPEKLHPDDIRALMQTVVHLRNPLAQEIPSINELASIAGMSTTKFKTAFKQLFGVAPISYHHKIKMEYAYEQIQTKTRGPAELSHLLGYSHPSNFTAAYKKYFGELPSDTGGNIV